MNLVAVGRNSTVMESAKDGLDVNRPEKERELQMSNSLLDPKVGIFDLDTMEIISDGN